MNYSTRDTCLAIAVAALATPLLGCGTSENGGSTPTSTQSVNGHPLAEAAPSGFDPCVDIPEQALTEDNLSRKEPTITEAPGGVTWQGCRWTYRGAVATR
ncbi:hypothetical protein ACFVVM_16000 [Nocardia sp. NPDC058176]|uniref:hypothetical protein n=1 Tax=Nocardia sp. NPDC058176 TaxID=3346368 RepID=UPI0036DF5104